MATAATIISTVVGVAGAVQQRSGAKKARRAQERAARLQNKQAAIARRRTIRQRLAESRVLRAQTISAGFAAGAPGATAVAGAVGGIQTDVAANIAASGQQFGLEQQRVGALGEANQAISQATQAGAVTQTIQSTAGIFTPQNVASLRGTFGI